MQYLSALLVLLSFALSAAAQTAVTTYHYDNNRTGWNQAETVLTPANVVTASFGLLKTVALNDQVDAQPLVVPGVQITAGNLQGTYTVVYVATESNTVYAIDTQSGNVLLSPNFGTPVTGATGCGSPARNVGITSTPVIDLTSNTMYVMVYTQTSTGASYYLHALNLGSLTDNVPPQLVTASHTLSNGTVWVFNAAYQRQRPALLLSNGFIYAGFGSFCDKSPSLSRGWVLGWTAGTLVPLPANQMNNQLATSPNNFFLSSVWMAGYGPATDDSGNILFVTGNSDPSGITYDGVNNIQESVVKVSSTLSSVLNLFTPSNQADLDEDDSDFGSGGVLVLPDQPGSIPHMAVAAGKNGSMYLMNEDSLGGYSTTTNNVLGTYSIGACWCGQSYFVSSSDNAGRVVSSGGNSVMVWKVATSPSPHLIKTAAGAIGAGVQDGGFFTSISSNGKSNPVLWALSRPLNATQTPIYLYAFNPLPTGTLKPIFSAVAGGWPILGSDSNLVPVVANGRVFVASYKQLRIFGLTQ